MAHLLLDHSLSRHLEVSASTNQLIVADGSSPDLLPLLSAARIPIQALPGVEPALQEITSALKPAIGQERSGTLHLVAHGRPGALWLNGQWIDRTALLASADLLATWNLRQIVLWSCNVGADEGFLALLSELSGAAVAASSLPIGYGAGQVIPGCPLALTDLFENDAIERWGGILNIVDVQGGDLVFINANARKLSVDPETSLNTLCLYKDVYTYTEAGVQKSVDALVLYNKNTNGASLANFDSLTDQFSDTTLFQPTVTIPTKLSFQTGGGSVGFIFNFIEGGALNTCANNTIANGSLTVAANDIILVSGVPITQVYNSGISKTCTLSNVTWNAYDIDSYLLNGAPKGSRQYVKTDQYDPTKVKLTSTTALVKQEIGGELCINVVNDTVDATDPPGTPQFDDYSVTVGMAPTDSFKIEMGDLGYKGSSYPAFFAFDFGPQNFGPPDLVFSKDVVGSTTVAPYQPVTFSYTVQAKNGSFSGSSIKITDDNATPTFLGDDFGYDGANPNAGIIKPVYQSGTGIPANTYVSGDTNQNFLVDPNESWKFQATVIPPVEMDVKVTSTAAPIDSGLLTWKTLANGDIQIIYRQSANFNDNTYGTGSDSGWTSQGRTHTFGNLVGSDKAGFQVIDSNGKTLFSFYQDYISLGGTNPGYAAWSGYQSLGYSGGDGDLLTQATTVGGVVVPVGILNSSAGDFLYNFDSTLETSMNQPGLANNGVAYTLMTTNSPTNGVNNPRPTDPKWDAVDGYSFVIKQSAFNNTTFGSGGFGSVRIFDQHNSPAKVGGSNSYVPIIRYEGSTNTAVVEAKTVVGNVTITKSDSATVQITDITPPKPPVKFYVPDDGTDTNFTYGADGTSLGSWPLNASNNPKPRDIATNLAGDKMWVIDDNKKVNVYEQASGTWAWKGAWTSSVANYPEGVAYDNFNSSNGLWTANKNGALQWYSNGGSNTTSSSAIPANYSVSLSISGSLKGIVADGIGNLFVILEGVSSSNDQIRRYTINRNTANTPTSLTLSGSWNIGNLGSVTGITLDPTQGSNGDLWVVAKGSSSNPSAYYRYAGARGLASNATAQNMPPSVTVTRTNLDINAKNTSPQGIADPDTLIGASGPDLGSIVPSYAADPILGSSNLRAPAFQSGFNNPFVSASLNPMGSPLASSSLGIGLLNYRGLETSSWLQHMAAANPFATTNSGF